MANNHDPYVYKGTKVLKNKPNIQNQESLQHFEDDASFLRIKQLMENPIAGKLDYKHLQAIHYHIFQDVYEWAGKPRTIKVTKAEDVLGGYSVAYPEPNGQEPDNNLKLRAEYAFSNLKRDEYLKGLDRPQFIVKLLHHATDIWEIHPFREGNTRAIITFIDHVAKNAGHDMTIGFYFEQQPQKVRDAFVLSTAGKERELRELFSLSLRQNDDKQSSVKNKLNQLNQIKAKSKGLSF